MQAPRSQICAVGGILGEENTAFGGGGETDG